MSRRSRRGCGSAGSRGIERVEAAETVGRPGGPRALQATSARGCGGGFDAGKREVGGGTGGCWGWIRDVRVRVTLRRRIAFEVVEEELGEAEAGAGVADFGDGREVAVGGVGGDLLDGVGLGGGFGVAGEVGAGGLKAVEEEAGAAGVDLVERDAAEDLADDVLDAGAVLGHGELEDTAAAAAGFGVGDGAAGGVVVVAEVLAAEGGTAAAVATGEDVAALEAFGRYVLHGGLPPPGVSGAKSSKDVV